MKPNRRKCLKCGGATRPGRWLCPACRRENENYAEFAEGVSDLFDI